MESSFQLDGARCASQRSLPDRRDYSAFVWWLHEVARPQIHLSPKYWSRGGRAENRCFISAISAHFSCWAEMEFSFQDALRKPLNERGSGRAEQPIFLSNFHFSPGGDFHFSWMARAVRRACARPCRACASPTDSSGANIVYL
jgi:hypothetical protein